MTRPFLAALCPTFRRPLCLRNSLACWLAQDYPADRREMIILDDAGQWPAQEGDGWRVVSVSPRFESLPAKFNALARLAPHADGYIVWEDDDVYLPWHLTAHAHALSIAGYSRPTEVWSNYGTPGKAIHREPAPGRFHGSWGYRRDVFEAIGGYREHGLLIFDQEMGQRMADAGGTADSCELRGPHFVYRFGNPYYHGQVFGDEYHAKVAQLGDPTPQTSLAPEMDPETERIYRDLRA